MGDDEGYSERCMRCAIGFGPRRWLPSLTRSAPSSILALTSLRPHLPVSITSLSPSLTFVDHVSTLLTSLSPSGAFIDQCPRDLVSLTSLSPSRALVDHFSMHPPSSLLPLTALSPSSPSFVSVSLSHSSPSPSLPRLPLSLVSFSPSSPSPPPSPCLSRLRLRVPMQPHAVSLISGSVCSPMQTLSSPAPCLPRVPMQSLSSQAPCAHAVSLVSGSVSPSSPRLPRLRRSLRLRLRLRLRLLLFLCRPDRVAYLSLKRKEIRLFLVYYKPRCESVRFLTSATPPGREWVAPRKGFNRWEGISRGKGMSKREVGLRPGQERNQHRGRS